MQERNSGTGSEVDRLRALLNAYHVSPDTIEAGFKEFSLESKNELVAQIARTFEPAPSGKLLARLLFILTDQNREDMMTAFLSNLHSSDPEARAASLAGLAKLGHPHIVDFALASLRDTSDLVVVAACNILIPTAKQDPRLWKILQELYIARKGNPEFHMSTSFLEAHAVNQ
jgi:hypothetical protein